MTLDYNVGNNWPTINDVHLNPQHKPISTRHAFAILPQRNYSPKLLNIIIPVSTQLGGNNSLQNMVAIHNLEPSSCKLAWRYHPNWVLYVVRLHSSASGQCILVCTRYQSSKLSPNLSLIWYTKKEVMNENETSTFQNILLPLNPTHPHILYAITLRFPFKGNINIKIIYELVQTNPGKALLDFT